MFVGTLQYGRKTTVRTSPSSTGVRWPAAFPTTTRMLSVPLPSVARRRNSGILTTIDGPSDAALQYRPAVARGLPHTHPPAPRAVAAGGAQAALGDIAHDRRPFGRRPAAPLQRPLDLRHAPRRGDVELREGLLAHHAVG